MGASAASSALHQLLRDDGGVCLYGPGLQAAPAFGGGVWLPLHAVGMSWYKRQYKAHLRHARHTEGWVVTIEAEQAGGDLRCSMQHGVNGG